ncbi:phosphodiester glycosidase family protein [Altererythrobacter sp. C41]|uniref:phosphodiester glycosidase family protein n=1 Tax=Altererythrobacter sp. C41 TaxID=2806021 RepID=UPI003083A6AA
MKRLIALAALLALAACEKQPAGEPVIRTEIGSGVAEKAAAPSPTTPTPTPNVASACESATFEGAAFTHCVADPGKHRVLTDLGPKDGAPYRSLAKLAAARGDNAPKVAFAMNGGMYDGEGKPIGYYVENGDRLQELNRADGPGNFHMKPNGVFFGTGGKWQIRTADDFYANVGDRPDFGTQSGPMLVIDGKLHPEISEDGPSKAIRNGVGIDAQGRAHFVISQGPVSFGVIARYFRDVLKTPDALFLDGSVSALWDPATDRLDNRAPIGPMIVVEHKDKP